MLVVVLFIEAVIVTQANYGVKAVPRFYPQIWEITDAFCLFQTLVKAAACSDTKHNPGVWQVVFIGIAEIQTP